jgi:hypothetical protein
MITLKIEMDSSSGETFYVSYFLTKNKHTRKTLLESEEVNGRYNKENKSNHEQKSKSKFLCNFLVVSLRNMVSDQYPLNR